MHAHFEHTGGQSVYRPGCLRGLC